MTFARYTGDEGEPLGLFVVRTDGSHSKRIAPAGSDVASSGSWSHGNQILFSRHLTTDHRQTLWLVGTNGHHLRQIHIDIQPQCGGPFTDPASIGCSQPDWSPRSDRIAFLVNDADGSHLYTATPKGGPVNHVSDVAEDPADWGVHPLL